MFTKTPTFYLKHPNDVEYNLTFIGAIEETAKATSNFVPTSSELRKMFGSYVKLKPTVSRTAFGIENINCKSE